MAELLIVALTVLGFALVSRRLTLSPVTAPMVFTTVGLVVGLGGLEWFELPLEGGATSVLVEATLVLVLFTDAVRIDLLALRRQAALPLRLLGIGLPLTVLAGVAMGALLLDGDLSLAEAALLAAVLAPTDAALGQPVVSDPRLPARVRQSLNVESGLNDGIMVPVVTVFLALAAAEAPGGPSDWVTLVTREIGLGLLAGLGAGLAGAVLLTRRRSGIEGVYRQLATLATAVAAFALAGLIDGNGFIGAFTAGLVFGWIAREHRRSLQDFTEAEAELLSGVTFLVFGAALAGPVLSDVTWQVLAYAALSLTVVRVVPVLIAMAGSGTLIETRLFLGWFGPRGLASILFALLVAEELTGPGAETVFAVACWTVLLSVYAHGLTASPWAARLARRIRAAEVPVPETGPAPSLPTRRRLGV